MELLSSILVWGFVGYVVVKLVNANYAAKAKAKAEWDVLLARKKKELTTEGYYFWRASNSVESSERHMYYKLAKDCQLTRKYKRK
jgi:hypothetical protein